MPRSMDHHEFSLSAVPLMVLFLWFNMSLASPVPSEDLEARSFADASFFRKHMTPGQFPANSFPVGKKTPAKSKNKKNLKKHLK